LFLIVKLDLEEEVDWRGNKKKSGRKKLN